MDNSNFNFLRETNFYLYTLAKDAERNLYVDNDTCLYKLRKIIEVIIKEIYLKENIENIYYRNLFFNINYLYESKYIGKLLYTSLNHVREECNYSIHNNIYQQQRVSEINKKVLETIKYTYIVCGYYIKMYFDNNVEIYNFIDRYYGQEDEVKVTSQVESKHYQEKYFNDMIELIFQELKEYLRTKSLIDNNNLTELSYEEFFTVYLETLNFMIVKNDNTIKEIFKLKDLCKCKINSTDGKKINIYISELVYKKYKLFS